MMSTVIIVNITPICNSLDEKSTRYACVHFKITFPYLGRKKKEELNAYCFALKATRVFPISTQAE